MRSRHLWQADVHFGGVLAGMALAALTVTASMPPRNPQTRRRIAARSAARS